MTEQFARALLQGPLIFGDQNQIEARRLLDSIEYWRRRLTFCPRCEGVGSIVRGRPPRRQVCWCLAHAPGDTLTALGVDGVIAPE